MTAPTDGATMMTKELLISLLSLQQLEEFGGNAVVAAINYLICNIFSQWKNLAQMSKNVVYPLNKL